MWLTEGLSNHQRIILSNSKGIEYHAFKLQGCFLQKLKIRMAASLCSGSSGLFWCAFPFLFNRVYRRNTKSMSRRPWTSTSTCQTMKVRDILFQSSPHFSHPQPLKTKITLIITNNQLLGLHLNKNNNAWFLLYLWLLAMLMCMFTCMCVWITQHGPMCQKFSERKLFQMLMKVFASTSVLRFFWFSFM